MKEISLLICLLAVAVLSALYYREDAATARLMMTQYKQNQEILFKNLQRSYHEKQELEKRNLALEQVASEETISFDWHADISNSAVIKQLQKR